MRHDRQNRRNVPLDVSDEKMDISSHSNYKIGKRKLLHTQLKKKKRMQCNDSDKKIHGAKVKEMKIFSCGKEKVNQASFAFFKVMCNNFEKFMVWFYFLLLSITVLFFSRTRRRTVYHFINR